MRKRKITTEEAEVPQRSGGKKRGAVQTEGAESGTQREQRSQ